MFEAVIFPEIEPGTKLISAHYTANAYLHLRMFSKALKSH